MTVTFRLLGPVEVWAGEESIDTGEPRRRAVLAALLIDAGDVVAASTLIDRVWGEEPPPSAAKTLGTHITRIRRTLERAAGDEQPVAVVNQSGGYRIMVDRARVDLHRFRRLVRDARDPVQTDEQRLRLLREAVGLRRGDPLMGLDGDWARRVREHLVTEQLEANVEWAETEIRLGNHAAVLTPLAELAAEHPLMEPLTGVLVRALAVSGRPSEALERCRAHRQRLIEELGTDQGSELRLLYQEILRGELRPARGPVIPVPAGRLGLSTPTLQDGETGPASGFPPPGVGPAVRSSGASEPAGPQPRHPMRRWRRMLTVGAYVIVLAALVVSISSSLVDHSADREVRQVTFPSVGPTFGTLLRWQWGYGPDLGSTATGEQWASAQVTGLIDTYHAAAFRVRVATDPNPENDPARHSHPDASGVLVSISSDHWQTESVNAVDFVREDVALPPSGLFRVTISLTNILTVTYAGTVLVTRHLAGGVYAGRHIFPAIYQSNTGEVRLSDIRSNAVSIVGAPPTPNR